MFVVFLACCLAVASAGQQVPSKPDPNLAAAAEQLQRKDFRSAIRSLELAERSAPRSNPEIYVLLSTAYLHVQEQAAAFESCLRGLKAIPGSARLERYCVSVVLTGPAEERAGRLEAALRTAPGSPYFQMALGRVLAEADWHNMRAEALLRAAARKLPHDPEARYRYADWLCSHEKNEQCVAEIAAALALDPRNLVAQMQGYAFSTGTSHDGLCSAARTGSGRARGRACSPIPKGVASGVRKRKTGA